MRYGDRATVDANLSAGSLVVQTDNVRALSLGPMERSGTVRLVADGQDLGSFDLSTRKNLYFEGSWRIDARPIKQKHHQCSGPISDLFFDGLILVPGTAGTEEETFHSSWVARHAASYYRSRNGGVHRGGIMGENWVDVPIVPDRELSDDDLAANNLLLYGTFASNAVMARFRDGLPLEFGAGNINLAGRSYTSNNVAVLAIYPHPRNASRYVAIHGGVTADAICWGSHLDMGLMPDYLVYDQGEVLDWGFWGNGWAAQV